MKGEVWRTASLVVLAAAKACARCYFHDKKLAKNTGGSRKQVLDSEDPGSAVPLHPGKAQGLLPRLRAQRVRGAEHDCIRVHVQQRSGMQHFVITSGIDVESSDFVLVSMGGPGDC